MTALAALVVGGVVCSEVGVVYSPVGADPAGVQLFADLPVVELPRLAALGSRSAAARDRNAFHLPVLSKEGQQRVVRRPRHARRCG